MSDRLYAALPVFAQDWACGFAGWRRARERFTPHFWRTLDRWERSIDGPIDELLALQRRLLDRLVRRARDHSPFYADLPPPSDARDPQEALARTLAAIPPLDKETYVARQADFLARDLPRRRLVQVRTSGTTGTALSFWQTRERVAEWYAVAWRQRRRLGVGVRDWHLTFGGNAIVPLDQREPPFFRRNAPGRQILFSNYHLAPAYLPAYVDAIHRLPARYVQGYPSALHVVAGALLEAGRPLPKGRLSAVFTSSESLQDFQRARIEDAFGAPVADYYSSSEMAVAMTGCAARRLHVDLEFCIAEVEVAEHGSDFERGALLVTGLGNDATPLLRYRIGDIGTRARGPCPCGRPGPSFLAIDGRIEDYVVTPDGRRIGRMDHVFKDQGDVAEAQILQDARDAITVLVVPRASYTDASEAGLRAELERRVGRELRIEIRRVPSIPREPGGKLRAVKSRVGALSA